MEWLEILGTLLAAGGFLLLSFNRLIQGFSIGLASCACLIPVLLNADLYPLLGLQLFFTCANIIGILNNWKK